MANNITTLAKRLRPFLMGVIESSIIAGVQEGPGVDIVTGAAQTIGLGGDSILLLDSAGSPAAEYAATGTGLAAALAAAGSGDVVVLPAGTITDDHSIPAGVTVVGQGGASVLSGVITNSGALALVTCSGTLSGAGDKIWVIEGGDLVANRSVQTDGQLISAVATGTAPLSVASTTLVTGLNADRADGYDFNQELKTSSSPSFTGLTVSGASVTLSALGTSYAADTYYSVLHLTDANIVRKSHMRTVYASRANTAFGASSPSANFYGVGIRNASHDTVGSFIRFGPTGAGTNQSEAWLGVEYNNNYAGQFKLYVPKTGNVTAAGHESVLALTAVADSENIYALSNFYGNLLVRNAAGTDVHHLYQDGSARLNYNSQSTGHFSVRGQTDIYLINTRADYNSVGIGIAASSTNKLYVRWQITSDPGAAPYGVQSRLGIAIPAGFSRYAVGHIGYAVNEADGGAITGGITGMQGYVRNSHASANVSLMQGMIATVDLAGAAATATIARAIGITMTGAAGSSVSIAQGLYIYSVVPVTNSWYGIKMDAPTSLGSPVEVYGIHLGNISGGSTNNYAIYTGTGDISLGDDLEFRQAATIRTTANNLTLAPAGDIELNPTGNDVLPTNSYDISLGSTIKKYLGLYVAELIVDTLIAQDVISTIGGRILVAPTTELTSDISDVATTLILKHNNLTTNDIVRLEARGQVEYILIGSTPSGTGPYTYTSCTRGLDSGGVGHAWIAGDAVVDTTNSLIDLYATTGVLTGSGPTIVGQVRQSSTWNDIEPRWAIGNLNGLYGVGASDVYGVAMGDPNVINVMLNDTDGLVIRNSTSVTGQWKTDGTIHIGSQTGEHVSITGAGMTLYDSANNDRVVVNTSGVELYGNNVKLLEVTASSVGIYDTSAVERLNLTTSGVRVGKNNDDRVVIADSGISIYTGASTLIASYGASITLYDTGGADRLVLSTSGITVGDTTDGEYVSVSSTGIAFWASGTQRGEFTGATGAFWFGAGSTAERLAYDTTNGLRIMNASNGAVMQFPTSGNAAIVGTLSITGSGFLQVGTLPAVKIDTNGVTIQYSSVGNDNINKLKFRNTITATTTATIEASHISSTEQRLWITMNPASAGDHWHDIYIKPYLSGTVYQWTGWSRTLGYGAINLIASGASDYIRFTSPNVQVDGDLWKYVSGATGNPFKGYIVSPLTTPWTKSLTSYSVVSTSTKLDISTFTNAPADTSFVKGYILQLISKDSTTWGTTGLYWGCGRSASLWYEFVVRPKGGDVDEEARGLVFCDSNGDLWYRCNASGTNTLDVTFYIWGILV